ncbi:Chymotrypsin-1 [Bulinus truncatus]|nr:Chymotrypsin-1 [Bulinus truncatus]
MTDGSELPSVYTKVAGYNDWINKRKHPKEETPEKVPYVCYDQHEAGFHSAPAGPQRTFDEIQDSRITNGVESVLFSRPYQASLQVHIPDRGWFHICGATIIDVDRLVCAAHCLTPFPANWLRVEVGVLNLRAPPLEYTQFIDVLGVEWHEDYSGVAADAFPNDIGVIYLKNPIKYNANVQPAKVAPVGQTFDEKECVISGWGSNTYLGGPSNGKLHEANMTKWTYEKCLALHQSFSYNISPTHLCVKGIPNEQGLTPSSCSGDSGGPLLCGEKRQYLVGATSYGWDCTGNYPSVYTKVSGYNEWINNRKHPKDNAPEIL